MRDDLNYTEIKTLEFALHFLDKKYGLNSEETKIQEAIHQTLIQNETLNVAQWWTVLEIAAQFVDLQPKILTLPVIDLLTLPRSNFPLLTRVEAHRMEWLSIQERKKNRIRVLDIQENREEWLTPHELASKLHLWKKSKKVKWLFIPPEERHPRKSRSRRNPLWKRFFPFLADASEKKEKNPPPTTTTEETTSHS